MENKRFYWIKLKFEFFFEDGPVDFIMRKFPKDGARYILLYQMLCLRTINNNGDLCFRLGEMLVQFDVDKIVSDCKYFKEAEVIVALELFKRLGLIFTLENGTLHIANFGEMVGSEGASAARMRKSRSNKQLAFVDEKRIEKPSQCDAHCAHNSVTPSVTSKKEIPPQPPKENRELEIETKSESEVEVVNARARAITTAPTLDEVRKYAQEAGIISDADKFYWYYAERNWHGVLNWKARLHQWSVTEKVKVEKQAEQAAAIRDVIPSKASDEFIRAELSAELEKDKEYRQLRAARNRASMAVSKEEIAGRDPSEDLKDALARAQKAVVDRIRQLGIDPEAVL